MNYRDRATYERRNLRIASLNGSPRRSAASEAARHNSSSTRTERSGRASRPTSERPNHRIAATQPWLMSGRHDVMNGLPVAAQQCREGFGYFGAHRQRQPQRRGVHCARFARALNGGEGVVRHAPRVSQRIYVCQYTLERAA